MTHTLSDVTINSVKLDPASGMAHFILESGEVVMMPWNWPPTSILISEVMRKP